MVICRVDTEQFHSSTLTLFYFASRQVMARRDRRDTLQRRRAFRPPRPRFLIVCEGTKTEPAYFRETKILDRSLIDLELSPEGVPKTLVERAVRMKRPPSEQKARRTSTLITTMSGVCSISMSTPLCRGPSSRREITV